MVQNLRQQDWPNRLKKFVNLFEALTKPAKIMHWNVNQNYPTTPCDFNDNSKEEAMDANGDQFPLYTFKLFDI